MKLLRLSKIQLTNKPVSYTHLDVYKRQLLPWEDANRYEDFKKAVKKYEDRKD